jgi:hypothetical protein
VTGAEIRRIQFRDRLYAHQGEHPTELTSVGLLDVKDFSPGTDDAWRGCFARLYFRDLT